MVTYPRGKGKNREERPKALSDGCILDAKWGNLLAKGELIRRVRKAGPHNGLQVRQELIGGRKNVH